MTPTTSGYVHFPEPEDVLESERAEFKNFHRQLCERFDYPHDEVNWKRDQASLIEHIANREAALRRDIAIIAQRLPLDELARLLFEGLPR